jgi:predicted  nucleic acid-binding Zn-ribbon protein
MSDTPRTDEIECSDDFALGDVRGIINLSCELERENARLAAELAEFRRTEPLKVAERNEWRDKAKRLEVELDDARDLYTQVQQQVCDLDRAESDKIQEVRQTVCDLRDDLSDARDVIDVLREELADARDALKAIWLYINNHDGRSRG